MTHKRNTEGLSIAAKQRREDTKKRVNTAIKVLLKEGKPINFNSISKAANVGKPWLYKEASVRQKIEKFRKARFSINENALQNTLPDDASHKSKDHIIQMLKDRINKLETENKKLQEQVQALYGEMFVKNNQ